MRTLNRLIPPGTRIAKPLLARAEALTLAFDERRKSRFATKLNSGEEVGVVLPRGTILADGDVLVAEDGTMVVIKAAAEPVLLITGASPLALMRAAYHLGNRHTPVEIGDGYLQIERDPVLADMLRRLGMRVDAVEAPFAPEAGAYGGGHKHGHDETFAEDYALAQQVYAERHGHSHAHDHSHEHDHGHSHDHDRNHSHDHAHAHGHDHKHEHSHAHGHDHAHDHKHEHKQAQGHGDDHDHVHSHDHDHSHSHAHKHEHPHDHDHEHGHKHAHGHDHGHSHEHGDHKHKHSHD
ncbi:urease accessory protein [Pararobbsia alpina]|uniref:urease accessory protein UreE n=1 Tax=Pararobbsia alpina TaxID=621374 RepID=UPI0039A57553